MAVLGKQPTSNYSASRLSVACQLTVCLKQLMNYLLGITLPLLSSKVITYWIGIHLENFLF